ncbi:hypothetical protein OsI_22830 [Oryza sativa Indica Group]|uniref:Uncharacterized protein n=1 Tax=Oryza sativa subsp. indica TaxID=39946 RepID=A2YCI8_ORYSI|nr:hypothetical protein OsI_22830 [Oryza sativa Indica Group]
MARMIITGAVAFLFLASLVASQSADGPVPAVENSLLRTYIDMQQIHNHNVNSSIICNRRRQSPIAAWTSTRGPRTPAAALSRATTATHGASHSAAAASANPAAAATSATASVRDILDS